MHTNQVAALWDLESVLAEHHALLLRSGLAVRGAVAKVRPLSAAQMLDGYAGEKMMCAVSVCVLRRVIAIVIQLCGMVLMCLQFAGCWHSSAQQRNASSCVRHRQGCTHSLAVTYHTEL